MGVYISCWLDLFKESEIKDICMRGHWIVYIFISISEHLAITVGDLNAHLIANEYVTL